MSSTGSPSSTPAAGGVTKINDQAHTEPGALRRAAARLRCAIGACPTAAQLAALREAHEGELYAPTGPFTVTNSYGSFPSGATPGYGVLYGQVGLATGTKPLVAPTEVEDAQTGDVAGVTAYNDAHEVTLDDGSSRNFWGAASARAHLLAVGDPVGARRGCGVAPASRDLRLPQRPVEPSAPRPRWSVRAPTS